MNTWSPPTGPAESRPFKNRTADRVEFYPAYPGQRRRSWLPMYMWRVGDRWWVQL